MPIRNYGISWDFDTAVNVGMYGKRRGEDPVYFGKQIGIYTLEYDDKTIYVGQTGVGAGAGFGSRLLRHKKNGKKFDAFSWFGMRPVRSTGTLVQTPNIKMKTSAVISDIETLAIALLELPLNLRTGKHRHMIRYSQLLETPKEWE